MSIWFAFQCSINNTRKWHSHAELKGEHHFDRCCYDLTNKAQKERRNSLTPLNCVVSHFFIHIFVTILVKDSAEIDIHHIHFSLDATHLYASIYYYYPYPWWVLFFTQFWTIKSTTKNTNEEHVLSASLDGVPNETVFLFHEIFWIWFVAVPILIFTFSIVSLLAIELESWIVSVNQESRSVEDWTFFYNEPIKPCAANELEQRCSNTIIFVDAVL